jgi:cholesterol transport system auxiliary component
MRSTTVRVLNTLLLGLLLGSFAACGGSFFTSNIAPAQTYRLTPLAGEAPGVAPFDALILVVRPVVAPGLDTERIAVLHPDRRVDYFAGSQWGAPVPDVIQSVVVESLQNTGRLRGVQRDLGNFRPDFVLQLDVRAFQAEYEDRGAPRIRVDLIATIGRLNDRHSVLSFAATASEPAGSNTMTAVAAAFDKSLQSATRTLLASAIDYVDHARSDQAQAEPAAPQTPPSPSQ